MSSVAQSHRNALSAGVLLLWYKIERVLGQGAFGITYLATDSNLHRPVAIKEYLPSQLSFREGDGSVLALTDDLADEYGAGLRRFIAEARTLAKFEHPSIVRVHNVFEANRTAYMVMQYEEGEDLGQILKRRRTLAEAEILHVLYPLMAGLEVIHAQGFVHRDIKPGNIFIRRDGTPLLLDFGSAREAIAGEARTLTNFVSPGYAPIEQYAGKSNQQGPWSDIYGLGATVYRAMTGRAPIDAVERSHALAQETRDSYQTGAESTQGNYSEALLAAVDRALRFRAQERPQSIAEWRQVLPPRATVDAATANLFAARAQATDAPLVTAAPTLMVTLVATAEQATHVSTVPLTRTEPNLRTEVHPSLAAGEADSPPSIPRADPEVVTGEVMTLAQRRWGLRHYLIGFAMLAAVGVAVGAWLGRSLGEGGASPDSAVTAVAPAPVAANVAEPALLHAERAAMVTPSSATAAPARVDLERQRMDRIADLLYGASQDLDAMRLMSPLGRNAYEKYREVLVLDPQHAAALGGIEAISDRYVGLVYRDLDAGRIARAETFLVKAEALSPDRPAVVEARAALETAKQVATKPPATTAAAAPAVEPGRMEKFRKRFDKFAREQKRTQGPRSDSRGNQFLDRMGGGR